MRNVRIHGTETNITSPALLKTTAVKAQAQSTAELHQQQTQLS